MSDENSDEVDSHFTLQYKPRLGLGSTENENIAMRRNVRELELLTRKHKMLGIEQEHMMKIIDLNCKNIQVWIVCMLFSFGYFHLLYSVLLYAKIVKIFVNFSSSTLISRKGVENLSSL